MDPKRSAQDLLRCDLCETPQPLLFCEICSIHLCKTCGGVHLLDESKEHRLVLFKKRGFTPECQNHSSKLCELYCAQCDIPICALCVSSKEHRLHDVLEILNGIESKRNVFKKKLLELEKTIYPKYEEIISDIKLQKVDLNENSQKLRNAINKHAEDLHREIDRIVQRLKSDLDEMDSKLLADLNRQEDEIASIISEIIQTIDDLKKLLKFKDFGLIFAYKSNNTDYRNLPPRLTVTLPEFTPHVLNKEQIYQQFGSLSAVCIKSEEHGYAMLSLGAESLIDVPRIITEINTDYQNFLSSVASLDDQTIWTCGDEDIMRLYNLQGELVESIQTRSGCLRKGNGPTDIAVTRSGDLVYTDYRDRTVNIVKGQEIQTVVRLQGWKPDCVCSTSSGNLLIVLDSDDEKETKVVRYSDSTEEQSIQYNDKGQPLFSSGYSNKYICQNRNLDICVSDCDASAVVVVNQAGKLRFTYTSPSSVTEESFSPHGIATDSQSRILIADCDSHCIHILDHDGQFLRFIESVLSPRGLCVDTRDYLFVAERFLCKVKKIQYCI